MEAERLTNWLTREPALLGNRWLETLDDRKQEEAVFHDTDRVDHRDEVASSTPNRRFYQAATVIERRIEEWFQARAGGAIFLDYACGNGKMSLAAANNGAEVVVGIDVSEVSVRNATENLATAGFGERSWFLQRDCESTDLPANTFSACLCSGMLHHLDLPRAFAELHRLMAPGGRILCVEALAYNPLIQWYRNRTPDLRTSWEKDHILGLADVRLARQWFHVDDLRFHLLAAPVATFLPSGPLRRWGLRFGHTVDAALTRVPGLQLLSWMFSFELVKPG